jgi:hypothetical protein
MTLNRHIAIGAAALLLAGAAGSALSHPHPEGEGEKVERIVVIHDGKDGEHRAKGKGERVRRFQIIRDGEGGHHARGPRIRRFEMHGAGPLAHCGGGDKIVDESAGDGGKKTKVIICRKGGAPTAATAKHIEDAIARIRTNQHLSDEQKAEIETALRSAMDRARSTR